MPSNEFNNPVGDLLNAIRFTSDKPSDAHVYEMERLSNRHDLRMAELHSDHQVRVAKIMQQQRETLREMALILFATEEQTARRQSLKVLLREMRQLLTSADAATRDQAAELFGDVIQQVMAELTQSQEAINQAQQLAGGR